MTDGFSNPPTTTGSDGPKSAEDYVAEINNSAPPAGTGGPSSTSKPTMVYVGYFAPSTTDDTGRGLGSQATGSGGANMVPIDVLLDNFEDLERWQQRQLALLLAVGGYLGELDLENVMEVARGASYQRVLDAYAALLENAAARTAAGQRLTPEQILTHTISYRLNEDWNGSVKDLKDILRDKGVKVGPEKDEDEEEKPKDLSGTFTRTRTDTSVNRSIMDPDDAMGMARAMMQDELGRDPTKEEMEDFVATIQHALRSNPSRSTTTTTESQTFGKKGRLLDTDVDTDTTTHLGITSEGLRDVALREARRNPDWAEWQAVGTYAPALFAALGATVPGV
jgi:hypothetical protein